VPLNFTKLEALAEVDMLRLVVVAVVLYVTVAVSDDFIPAAPVIVLPGSRYDPTAVTKKPVAVATWANTLLWAYTPGELVPRP
jgi:hypothetical protein